MLLLVTMKSEFVLMLRKMMLLNSDAILLLEVVPGLIGLILNGQEEDKVGSIFVLLVIIYGCLIIPQTIFLM